MNLTTSKVCFLDMEGWLIHVGASLLLLSVLAAAVRLEQKKANDTESSNSLSQCKAGWVPFKSSCYKLITKAYQTWHVARHACMQENSRLVSIQTLQEFEFLQRMIKKVINEEDHSLIRKMWWTAGRRDKNGTWIWDDGTPVRFKSVNWYPGQPSNVGGSEGFLNMIYANREWGMNDGFYDLRLRSICEYDTNPTISCRNGWKSFDGHCYEFVVSQDRTWQAAKKACEQEGSHLVTVESSLEFRFLKDEIREILEAKGAVLWHELWWTGGRKGPNSTWVWQEGNETSPIDFDNGVNWYPGEPNNQGGHEDYLDILYMHRQWGMNDAPNNFHLRSICEYVPNSTPVKVCPTGWKLYINSCYKFVLQSSTHSEASVQCEAESANLVSINSDAEFDFLKVEIEDLVRGLNDPFEKACWWTSGVRQGFHDYFMQEGDYYKSVNPRYWYPGQPSTYHGTEKYVNIFYGLGIWGLSLNPDNLHMRYICKKSL